MYIIIMIMYEKSFPQVIRKSTLTDVGLLRDKDQV